MATETKVGVYLCSGCGIGDSVDMEKLAKVASDEYKIPVCKTNAWLCNKEGIDEINKDISENELNRIVIGACSQRFLTDVFKFDDKILSERVNLRENVVWSHKPNDEDTQMMAEDYLRMGIAKVQTAEPPSSFEMDVNETILVVGGGITGLNSALSAAKTGKKVVLVEKENELGGWINKFHKITPQTYPYTNLEDPNIEELINEVESNENISVFKSCTVKKISGQPGEFDVKLIVNGEPREETLKIGSIVQATGWKPYDANKLDYLGYGKFDNVVTNIQFEEFFKNGNDQLIKGDPKSFTFIQCAGSRDEKHLPYCSSVCCSVSLKQAMYVREKYPDALIYIIYKDMRTPAQSELFYKKVQDEDNVFLTKGEIVNVDKSSGGEIVIDVDNTLLGEQIQIKSDVLVLATGMVPTTLVGAVENAEGVVEEKEKLENGKKAAESAEKGAKILNLAYRQGTDLPTLKYGFPDSHYICFPYETRRTGIYAAGTVRAPMDLSQCNDDSSGATLKAIQMVHSLKNGVAVHPRSGDKSFPDFFLQRCTQCKRCTEECPFGTLDEDEKGTPLLNPARCRRCGICLGACPERIISFKDYSIKAISAMIKSIDIPDEFDEKPRLLAFMCENDAYPSMDIVGKNRIEYSPFIRIIPVRCLGAVNAIWIADALSRGFDGILLIGCKYGDDYQCHFIKGSELASKRMGNVQEKLKQLVLEHERVELHALAIDEYHKIPQIINDFADEIEDIGYNPYKGM